MQLPPDFLQFAPCPALRACVKCFWLLRTAATRASTDSLLPSGSLELVFNLSGTALVSVVNGRPEATPHAELMGQITQPFSVQMPGATLLLGVRFHPHAAGLFLKSSVGHLNDTITNLADVFGSELVFLQEQLFSAATVQDRIQHLERFLLAKLAHGPHNPSHFQVVQLALRRLLSQPHEASLGIVATECGISQRHLQTLFLNFVGLRPKQFVKIARLQRSIGHLHQSPASLTAVAYDCGYYDQSHFIRDFKSFTGLTPSQYEPAAFPLNGIIT